MLHSSNKVRINYDNGNSCGAGNSLSGVEGHRMKKRIAYKVTTLGDRSAWVRGRASVKYVIGRKVRAPQWLRALGYGLFVFKTYPRAHAWATNILGRTGFAIHECEVGPFMKVPQTLDCIDLARGVVRALGKFWPQGTHMVEWVRLLPDEIEEE